MKSDSLTFSEESEDSVANLNNRIIRRGNIYPSKGEAGQVVSDKGISPTIKQAKRGGMAAIPIVSLDSSTSLEASEDSDSDSKKQTRSLLIQSYGLNILKEPISHSLKGQGSSQVHIISYSRGNDGIPKHYLKKESISNTLKDPTGNQSQYLLVSGTATKTDTQPRPTTKTSKQTTSRQTSRQSKQKTSQTMICSVQDSHVSLFQLLENERVSKILEELCSMKYLESHRRKNLDCYSWRMSKDSYQQTMEGVSLQSSHHFQNWGMTVNGRCLTVRTSECHRTGNGCSLSDILEETVDSKYFLSDKAMEGLKRIL